MIPVKPLYDDADLIAIEDINPQAPLHVLIIPKAHIPSLNDLTPEHDALVGRDVPARGRRSRKSAATPSADYRTVFNTNREAGQSVFHIHLHLLAGRSLGWPPG